jgi:hypothetical protein
MNVILGSVEKRKDSSNATDEGRSFGRPTIFIAAAEKIRGVEAISGKGYRKGSSLALLPSMPKTVQETGIARLILLQLVAKTIFLAGRSHLSQLGATLKLSINVMNELLKFMTDEQITEVVRRGATDIEVEYQLTDNGRRRAAEYLAQCRYVGPAPVTLDDYRLMVERQSVRGNRVTHHDIAKAFSEIRLNPVVRDQVGAAMNSGRPLFMYGAPGSGKTFIAERLCRLMQGSVAIPHAIVVNGEIIQMFDPLVHEVVDADIPASPLDRRQDDTRWQLCKRPIVLTGGELTLEMLDLQFDKSVGFYQAPPHLKASNGIFIVDDLGRQRVAPQDLMNRWIVPLDRAQDYMTLHTGYKFGVPFDMTVVFSTNMDPEQIADEAFLRRLGYKIAFGAMGEEDYEAVVRQQADALGVAFSEAGFRYLVDALHVPNGRPLLATYPRDLLRQVVDYADFWEEEPALTPAALERAWSTYFGAKGRSTASAMNGKSSEPCN